MCSRLSFLGDLYSVVARAFPSAPLPPKSKYEVCKSLLSSDPTVHLLTTFSPSPLKKDWRFRSITLTLHARRHKTLTFQDCLLTFFLTVRSLPSLCQRQ